MKPIAVVHINGRPISSFGWSRLLNLTLTDKKGTGSDTVALTFTAGRTVSVPRKKDLIQVRLGYEGQGLAYFGSFEVNDAELACIPYTIDVSGKATDMKSELKTNQSRHWDDNTVGGIFTELAEENGLTPVISGKIAEAKYPYMNMEDESVLHFGERIAARENGLFDVKDGKLIMIDNGAGLSGSGLAVTPLIITPPMSIVGSCRVKFSGRDEHKEVETAYHDKEKAKREIVKAPAGGQEGVLRLKHAFGNKEEAERAAKSKAKALQRRATSASVTIVGDARARGGAPMRFQGFHPQADGQPFIIETATHNVSKAGWTTAISGEAQI